MNLVHFELEKVKKLLSWNFVLTEIICRPNTYNGKVVLFTIPLFSQQSCTKLLGHCVIKSLFPAPQNQCCALGMRHVYTNIAWWGREGEDACLEHGYWIIHVILYTYILIMNVMMISRACVPTSFVQDCIQLPKKLGTEIKDCLIKRKRVIGFAWFLQGI